MFIRDAAPEDTHKALATRNMREFFSATSVLAIVVESPENWGYDEFRRCRTFDEVKLLAVSKSLKATNEFGRIDLFRNERLVGSFWLFD